MREVLAMNGALNNTVVEEGESVFVLAERRAESGSRAARMLLDHAPSRAGMEISDFTVWMMIATISEELLEQRARLDALEGEASPG
jgi:membrane protease subunit (stomatin/prohibitin family)